MSDELTKVRVLIVSLDRLSRAGLAAELDQQLGLVVVGQIAGDEDSSLPLGVYDPDVIVWDVSCDWYEHYDGWVGSGAGRSVPCD